MNDFDAPHHDFQDPHDPHRAPGLPHDPDRGGPAHDEPDAYDPYGSGPDHDLAVAAGALWDGSRGDAPGHDDSGFHPVNVTHLVMGIAFLAFAGIWAVLTADVVESDDLRWLLPVPWLLAGTVGLVASVAGRRARRERRRLGRSHDG